MKKLNLSAMTFDDLLALRNRINQTLSKRIVAEKDELKAKLARLDRIASPGSEKAVTPRGRKGRRGKVAAKFRNPANRSETWSGRGRTPRWMVAAMKATGKKVEDFRIGGRKG